MKLSSNNATLLVGYFCLTTLILPCMVAKANRMTSRKYKKAALNQMEGCLDDFDFTGMKIELTVSEGSCPKTVKIGSKPVWYDVATVVFDCDDKIMSAVCDHKKEQVSTLGCDPDDPSDSCSEGWCRQTAEDPAIYQCTSYAQQGESCEGYTMPQDFERCDPSLSCMVPKTDPQIVDISGTCCNAQDYFCNPLKDNPTKCECAPIEDKEIIGLCLYNGIVYYIGNNFDDTDGCNSCHCGKGGLSCTKMAFIDNKNP
jgi:hypothetical protein